MSSPEHPHPTDDSQAGKRRKVNTCLQCKSRKVKCDKVRPHCGPCQRRRIPLGDCIWADEADPETLQHHLASDPAAEWSTAYTQQAAAPLLGLSETDARAVLERISRLEMKIRGEDVQAPSVPQVDPLVLASATAAGAAHARALHTTSGSPPPPTAEVASATLSETDAIVLLAQQGVQVANSEDSSLPAQFPFPNQGASTKEQTKTILGLLPNDHVVNVLLDSFRAVETGTPLGVNWKLIRIQLINLRGEIADWRAGQVTEPEVDLSFLALLFQLMVGAIECKKVEEIVAEGIAATLDQVSEMLEQWHATSQSLLSMTDFIHQPNLNTILTVSLFRIHLIRRNEIQRASNYLNLCLSLSRRLGIHRLGTAASDASRWLTTPESEDTTIRTGPVTATLKAIFQGGESFAVLEEARLLKLLDTGPIRTVASLPDRTHLVRESARGLWCALKWHVMLGVPGDDVGDWEDESVPSAMDEAELPDGESFEFPEGGGVGFHALLAKVAAGVRRESVDEQVVREVESTNLRDEHRAILNVALGLLRIVSHRTNDKEKSVQAAKSMLEAITQLRQAPSFSPLALRPFLDLAEFNASLMLALHDTNDQLVRDHLPHLNERGQRFVQAVLDAPESAVKTEDQDMEQYGIDDADPLSVYLNEVRKGSELLQKQGFFTLLEGCVFSGS